MNWNGFIENYLTEYSAEDGGGKFEPSDDIPPLVPEAPFRTTKNENSVLILAEFVETCQAKGFLEGFKSEFKANFFRLMESTRVRSGLHSRRQGNTLDQSHDNIVAMSVCSKRLGTSNAKEIDDWGRKHFYNYNVNEPEKWKLEAQLLGMDIAVVQLCADRSPGLLWTLWLAGALINIDPQNSGSILLSNVRIQAIKMSTKLWGPKKWLLNWAAKKHISKRGDLAVHYRNYYNRPTEPVEHPIITMQGAKDV